MPEAAFASYEDAYGFLFNQLPFYQNQGPKALKFDLSNITELMAALGNPQRKFKSIHIAGTNGKGSTAHMISAVFQSNGYKTGLYTSPHYKDFRERIKLNGRFVEKDFLLKFMNDHFALIEWLKPSYFELSVAMAFEYFAFMEVDIAIVEVGLGGRLDSTNIILPLLTVITNISLDHTQTLGEDLASIAGEKAGIVKKSIPLVVGEKQTETTPVYLKVTARHHAPLYFAGELTDIQPAEKPEDRLLTGPFNEKNILTAKAAIWVFQKYYADWNLTPQSVNSALLNFQKISNYIGRWTVLGKNPLIIADGAHNQAAWKYTIEFLRIHHKAKIHFVLGFVFDKNIDEILKILPDNATYYFCKANIPRAMGENELLKKAGSFNLSGRSFQTVADALDDAKSSAGQNDLIFIGGSIFVVGEIL